MNNILFSISLNEYSQATIHEDSEGQKQLRVTGLAPVNYQEQAERILLGPLSASFPPQALLALLGSRFSRSKKCARLMLEVVANRAFAIHATRLGVIDGFSELQPGIFELQCKRQTFWQNPLPWLTAPFSGYTAPDWCFSGEKRHPRRPPISSGEVYRRYLPGLNASFSLRTVNLDRDLQAFNKWMNLEQIAYFWEQTGTQEEHAAYLAELFEDPRVHPLIGCFDDEPFAYFEVYWCKEDRIAPYYDVHDYDRGWHVAIGESKHQSVGKLKAWFQSLMHYIFLDDLRTQRILGEPRIDHGRQIDFLKSQGYGHLKSIQLPHKQAALLRLERETFFDTHRL
ncbi:GNAT family N-acetyltransferase [Azorhizophilus paspali]|uniref:GNAT family N-acetyltransferase n=1 Tax=Azorhizophilus paspali TaxID=69963 RepID=A0ABV6SLX7_AZOPA